MGNLASAIFFMDNLFLSMIFIVCYNRNEGKLESPLRGMSHNNNPLVVNENRMEIVSIYEICCRSG